MAHVPAESRLTIAEAATFLRTTPRHIQLMYRDGRLPHIKVGRKVLFLATDLEEFVAQNRIAARPSSPRT